MDKWKCVPLKNFSYYRYIIWKLFFFSNRDFFSFNHSKVVKSISVLLRESLISSFGTLALSLNMWDFLGSEAKRVQTFHLCHLYFQIMSRLNLAGKFFVHPCGESYLEWSLGQSALLSDLVFTDLQIWVQKNQKRLALLTDISKCPENHHQLKYHILSTVTKILVLLTPQERSEMQRYWVEIRQNLTTIKTEAFRS